MIRSSLVVLALSATVAVAASCSSSEPVPDGPSDPVPGLPSIVSFNATSATIASGESAELSWEVTGAKTVSISEGVGEVSGKSVQVRPEATTTYTLTATNERGSTTANTTVAVSTAGGTDISGSLTTRTLTFAGSPYRVTGDLTVPAGSRLTLEPGVRLVFAGHFKLAVYGRITAQGTTARPIVFTAANPTTGWAGMRLAATSDAGADFLERCIFEYGNKDGGQNGMGEDGSYSEDAGGALWIGSRANVNVNYNEFRFNKAPTYAGALMLIAPTSSGVATGNNFHDNSVTGPRTQFGGVGGAVNTAHLPASNNWTFRGGEFRNNRAHAGGALYFFDSNVTIDGIEMSGNTPNNWATPEPQRLTVVNTPK
ncbi:hypothetical protein [Pyxidicoccus xibeiensis]|uniref:hypothetical protein n=1 Tax=Pyxidicoccus xibeiensis TaxID=2906759 RepID=UPI0020A7B250|nr:hypothetical protein [Pyxidicoccus xibeiensis]MCP3138206.1 hypothetical protein [Pyxidicoccus xibeiensis]